MCSVYGITGDALDWFRSYLTGRIQRVVIEDSVDQELGFGVPQDSILGPKIYCMTTNSVSDIIQRHVYSRHYYADDTQLYMTRDHSNNNWRDGMAYIQLCISEIREWIDQNMLKLYDDKRELIVSAPNDSLQAVYLSRQLQTAVQIVSKYHAPSHDGPIYYFGASWLYGPAELLALLLIKAGDVETNPGPTTTHKKVWICDICHKQIHGRKQISIRSNRIEHWVHLRCACIRLAQYTDTWTYHLHKESELTQS